MYTDEFIQEILLCAKEVIDSPKGMKEDRGHLKNNFTLQSVDGLYSFNRFIRQCIKFNEDFSIGLDYNPKNEKGTITLLRCNGLHGGTVENPHHAYYHIHKCSADRINQGLRPEGIIELTTEYSTLETAIQYFVKYINIVPQDRQKFFPPPSSQIDFNFNERIIDIIKRAFNNQAAITEKR